MQHEIPYRLPFTTKTKFSFYMRRSANQVKISDSKSRIVSKLISSPILWAVIIIQMLKKIVNVKGWPSQLA